MWYVRVRVRVRVCVHGARACAPACVCARGGMMHSVCYRVLRAQASVRGYYYTITRSELRG